MSNIHKRCILVHPEVSDEREREREREKERERERYLYPLNIGKRHHDFISSFVIIIIFIQLPAVNKLLSLDLGL